MIKSIDETYKGVKPPMESKFPLPAEIALEPVKLSPRCYPGCCGATTMTGGPLGHWNPKTQRREEPFVGGNM